MLNLLTIIKVTATAPWLLSWTNHWVNVLAWVDVAKPSLCQSLNSILATEYNVSLGMWIYQVGQILPPPHCLDEGVELPAPLLWWLPHCRNCGWST